MCKIRKMQRQCGIYIFFFPNLFSEGNYPVEGFGYVSTIIYITTSASGCCLQLVHAQRSLAGACHRGRSCKNVFPDRTRFYAEKHGNKSRKDLMANKDQSLGSSATENF